MYPSGAWRGWWQQAGWGRQPMEEFALHFAGGRVRGQGTDVIGAFAFTGTYDDAGRVALVKQYLGRHKVWYDGRWDGEGTVYGTWNIGDAWTGPFAMTPIDFRAAADTPVLAIAVGSGVGDE